MATAEELAEADWTLKERLRQALARMGVPVSPETPLRRLSGGQRAHAALAAATFAGLDLLLHDEPNNDHDPDGRQAVHTLLKAGRAGAVVVSHDRALLDAMDAIVELSPAGASRYQGNFHAYQDAKAVRIAAAEHDLAVAEKRTADLARRSQETLERQQQRDVAGQRRGARGDLPRILVGARRDNAEKSAGGSARAAERQRTEARQQLKEARSRIQAVKAVSIAVPSSGLHAAKTVLSVERVTFGHRPGQPVLEDVSLTISGSERVAISGRRRALLPLRRAVRPHRSRRLNHQSTGSALPTAVRSFRSCTMSVLIDRQRIELALPAYLLFALSKLPGVFAPSDPALAERAEADIAALSEDLRIACMEPFTDLAPRKQQALLRRLDRIGKDVIAEWADRSSLSLVLTLWYFLKDLVDREVLILWQGSAMDRAVHALLPMFEHGFEQQKRDAAAQGQAVRLLARLRAEGLYG